MSPSTLEAQIEAAKAYEALCVPALFAQWAPHVVDAARMAVGQRVLDVACGTGALAREAHLRTGLTGSVVGLDPYGGMLVVAGELAPAIDWRQGTAESMPFPKASFDVVLSQFGLVFMDPDKAIREMLRVLKPAGRLAVAVWDRIENNPAYLAEVALIERLAGTRAADALRAPFLLGDREHLLQVFNGAGAGSVVITTQRAVARFPSIRVMVEADLRGWLPVMGVNLSEEIIRSVLAKADAVLAPYAKPDGRVAFEVQALVVTAVAGQPVADTNPCKKNRKHDPARRAPEIARASRRGGGFKPSAAASEIAPVPPARGRTSVPAPEKRARPRRLHSAGRLR